MKDIEGTRQIKVLHFNTNKIICVKAYKFICVSYLFLFVKIKISLKCLLKLLCFKYNNLFLNGQRKMNIIF